jgi:hypothetical protein
LSFQQDFNRAKMTISEFWAGIALGIILGFGAGVILFLPIVLTHTDLEDALDARRLELRRLISSIEQIRARLDEMIDRRTVRHFNAVLAKENGAETHLQDLRGVLEHRKMERHGGN